MQFGGARAVFKMATPWFPLVFEWRPRHQSAQQRLCAGGNPARRYDRPSPGGDHGVGLHARMYIKSLVEAVSYARYATDSLYCRQARQFPILSPLFQRGLGDNPLDPGAFLQKALRRFEPAQIVDQFRCRARRRREFRRLGLAEIESAD